MSSLSFSKGFTFLSKVKPNFSINAIDFLLFSSVIAQILFSLNSSLANTITAFADSKPKPLPSYSGNSEKPMSVCSSSGLFIKPVVPIGFKFSVFNSNL